MRGGGPAKRVRDGGQPEEELAPCEEEEEGDADSLRKVRQQERLERRCAPPWVHVTGA